MKRRKWTREEKLAIVTERKSMVEICRKHQISQTLYYRWVDELFSKDTETSQTLCSRFLEKFKDRAWGQETKADGEILDNQCQGMMKWVKEIVERTLDSMALDEGQKMLTDAKQNRRKRIISRKLKRKILVRTKTGDYMVFVHPEIVFEDLITGNWWLDPLREPTGEISNAFQSTRNN